MHDKGSCNDLDDQKQIEKCENATVISNWMMAITTLLQITLSCSEVEKISTGLT